LGAERQHVALKLRATIDALPVDKILRRDARRDRIEADAEERVECDASEEEAVFAPTMPRSPGAPEVERDRESSERQQSEGSPQEGSVGEDQHVRVGRAGPFDDRRATTQSAIAHQSVQCTELSPSVESRIPNPLTDPA